MWSLTGGSTVCIAVSFRIKSWPCDSKAPKVHLELSYTISPLSHDVNLQSKQTEIENGTYNFRFEWGLNFPGHELQPVNVSKEHVVFDVLLSIISATQAFGRVLGQELKTQQVQTLVLFLSVSQMNWERGRGARK